MDKYFALKTKTKKYCGLTALRPRPEKLKNQIINYCGLAAAAGNIQVINSLAALRQQPERTTI